MAWVGAIVIVVGAGFLVKLGYDAGLWGRLPTIAKCLLVAGFGATLLGAGEIALRRIGQPASVGLFGAGLGILYLDAYATFAWYDLATGGQAFLLMGLVAGLGFAITLRSSFLTIGVLSIVGGYLALWLVRGESARYLEVGIYLTALLGIALGLSMFRPAVFRPLRYVALGGQALMGLTWALGATSLGWFAVLFLVSLWWAMVIAEVVAAAIRAQSPRGNVVASLLSTAWYVSLGTYLLAETQPAGSNWLGIFTAAVAVVAAVIALHFGPRLSELAATSRSAMDRLAIALWAQGGVLLVVAIALQFDGYGQSIGWLAVGLASIEIGRRLPSRAVNIFGLVVGGLAVARVALIDSQMAAMNVQLQSVGSVIVTNWSILALATILAVHAAAWRLGRGAAMPVLLAVFGTLGWLGLCILQAGPLTATAGWLAASALLVALQRWGGRQRYLEIGLVVLAATAGKWLITDALLPRLAPGWDPTAQSPLLNWQMGLAVAIAAVGGWTARSIARRPASGERRWSAGAQLSIAGGVVFLLVAMSFELHHLVRGMGARGVTLSWSMDQLFQILLTILWAVGSVTLGILARVIAGRHPGKLMGGPQILGRFALALLMACAVKWVLGDTLYYAVFHHGGAGALPLANAQMLAGAVLAASALATVWAIGGKMRVAEGGSGRLGVAAWIPAAAAVIILWGLSFEIDRAIGRYETTRPAEHIALWAPFQVRALWWTGLWAAGGLAMLLWARRRAAPGMIVAGWAIVVIAGVAWLTYDTIYWRFAEGVVLATPVFNLQFAIGVLLAIVLAASVWHLRALARNATDFPLAAGAPFIGLAILGLIGLWLGSIEIDRFFAPEAARLARNAAMARQTGLSIYWALFAIAAVALGFARRWPICRYAGLALLILTLGKVLTIDMAGARYVYRVLSLLAVGLLFVATSIGYTKLAPRLLSEK